MWFFKKKDAEVKQDAPEKTEDKAEEKQPAAALSAEPAAPEKANWIEKVKTGLSRSSNKLTEGITGIFTRRKLDHETLAELEELLITADIGPAIASRLVAALAKDRFDKEISPDEIRAILSHEIAEILAPAEKPLVAEGRAPFVIMVAGVNGAGKTTTIGKLAQQFTNGGKKVMLAAGDTFRAAAVQQLQVWGARVGCPVVAKAEGADAAALAFEALDRAVAEGVDILILDTAGRLQNKANLMDELSKIVRVIQKKVADAPHATVLVLDGTVGQNAHSQVELFRKVVDITGLIVTKLDGTAKGGVVVSLVEKFGLPVHAIGIGEGVDDLRPFSAAEYATGLTGVASGLKD